MSEQESTKTLEEEIRALEEKLAARKQTEDGTGSGEMQEEKEIFRDVLKEEIERVKERGEQKGNTSGEVQYPAVSFPPLQAGSTAQKQKVDELKEREHHEQVEALVEIALTKGIGEAVMVARHLENPHLLDDFHDALVDEYYEKLLLSRELP